MKLNFERIILGIILTLTGVGLYKTGWSNMYEAPVPKPLAVLFCIFGTIIFVAGFFSKKFPQHEGTYVCANCNKKYKAKDIKIKICPICDGQLSLTKDSNKKAT